MDNTIRNNEICVIGQPRCDFAYSSTRSCFIAYGFEESTLEMNVLRGLLKERQIETIEAGGALSPAQNAFCSKICSKIITAQFCIVLLNNKEEAGQEIPNANVNMEYGLMLGFNKYVIPFQKTSQTLPFNVHGLDTVKYSSREFELKATSAIDQAIIRTQQKAVKVGLPDQQIESFILSRKALFASVDNQGDKVLFDMGRPLGFNLLHDFGGLKYIYFGNFTMLRSEIVLRRLRLIEEIMNGRSSSLPQRHAHGMITSATEINYYSELLNNFHIWTLVTSDEDKRKIVESLSASPLSHHVDVFSLSDVSSILEQVDNAH